MTDDDDPPPFYEPQHETTTEGIVPLGFDHGTFYYLSHSARQIFALSTREHSRTALCAMASIPHYWQRTRFVTDKGQIRWEDAIDNLMHQCREVGIYDPDRVRGRGAWLDDGRSVVHLGDRLLVDGQSSPLMLAGSKHVYEASRRLMNGHTDDVGTQLSNRDAHALVEICRSLRWESPMDGLLLAGWIATAPVCGGLAWRPSLWITGAASSGKTWLQDNIIGPALGGIALRVQSKTSEAGIRQTLGSDARPVIFDEAEREDHAAASRMQAVLDLVRQSSSESGAEIVKGTQNQSGAKRYRIRSSFLFSSINVGIEHHADETRITVLSLRAANPAHVEDDAKQFAKLTETVVKTITPDFAAALLVRSAGMLPVIRQNAERFAVAVAVHLGSRRLGDQIGTLLAGAHSLHTNRALTAEQALTWVRKQSWEASAIESDTDDVRLVAALTQHKVRISPGNGGSIECTVGRLIGAAFGRDQTIVPDVAERELRQVGYRTAEDGVYVSTSHPAIRAALEATPWSAGWSRTLLRLPGAISGAAMRFGIGHLSKATYIPMAVLDGPD